MKIEMGLRQNPVMVDRRGYFFNKENSFCDVTTMEWDFIASPVSSVTATKNTVDIYLKY